MLRRNEYSKLASPEYNDASLQFKGSYLIGSFLKQIRTSISFGAIEFEASIFVLQRKRLQITEEKCEIQ